MAHNPPRSRSPVKPLRSVLFDLAHINALELAVANEIRANASDIRVKMSTPKFRRSPATIDINDKTFTVDAFLDPPTTISLGNQHIETSCLLYALGLQAL